MVLLAAAVLLIAVVALLVASSVGTPHVSRGVARSPSPRDDAGAEVRKMSVAVHHIGPRTARPPSERRTVGRRVRRIGLGAFFASVAVNAALGIAAVLMPHFGDTARNVLVTSLCVTGAVLVGLCCEPAWERRLLGQVPTAGALLGALAFAGLIVGIWIEPASESLRDLLWSTFAVATACTLASVVVLERARKGISLGHQRVLTLALGLIALAAASAVALIWTAHSGDTEGKFTGTCRIAVVVCALAAVLTLTRLAPQHRWVLAATLALLGLGAVLIVANIWLDVWGLTRAMGVVLIAFAAFAVTVPVLHWLDRGVVAAAAVTGDAIRYCPHCGRKLTGEVGVKAHCDRCGRGFTVTPAIST